MLNKKRISVVIIIILLLLLTVGYSYLSEDLTINGISSINNSKWSIIWDNVNISNGSVSGASIVEEAHITNQEKTIVEYSIILSNPGEYYEFTVDAKNTGTIDGMVDIVSNKVYEENGTTEKELPSYLDYSVTYSDNQTISSNHLIKAGEKETYKVRVEFKKDIESSDLPQESEIIKFKFGITYKQADSNATEVNHSQIVYTANVLYYGTSTFVNIGQEIDDRVTQYDSADDALSALRSTFYKDDIVFYLKHIIQNGIVVDSYVEFIITPLMASSNNGMVAGTYSLRGFDTYDVNQPFNCKSEYYDTSSNVCMNPYYENNKQVVQVAFGSSYCNEGIFGERYKYYTCSVPGLKVNVYSNGHVSVWQLPFLCTVDIDGQSICSNDSI